MEHDTARVAQTRFGLGPRPGAHAAAAADPRAFVTRQCDRPDAALITDPQLQTIEGLRTEFARFQTAQRAARRASRKAPENRALRAVLEATQDARNARQRAIINLEIEARFAHTVASDTPFVERLVLFWRNHFAISSASNLAVRWTMGNMEREAIRPHVLGTFGDMLLAATTHPAMLLYLDNFRSIGPNSRRGRRRGITAPNENLAREVLELHTLGVDGGYTQGDVVELANAMTGWVGGFFGTNKKEVFVPGIHEPGFRTVLGKTYSADGPTQLPRILADLATHPATARHVAQKFARSFVSDQPSPALVGALVDTFRRTGGDLRALSLTLVDHPDAWAPPPSKAVPPYEFAVAATRATGAALPTPFLRRASRAMAQDIFRPPSPAGWPSDDDAFLGGDGLLERVDFAEAIARRFAKDVAPRALADALFGEAIDPFLDEALARAESRTQALTLLLMSPPFHRR
ncbi:MAG: DUF1800 domain-containing protein [Pseudomonadota bacterium]